MHPFMLHNGAIRGVEEKVCSPGQVGLLNGWGVFSTLRVKDGVLFEWDRHVARMRKDAALLSVPFPEDTEKVRTQLATLIEANGAYNATLRLVVVRNKGGLFETPHQTRDFDLIAFTRDLKNWGDSVRLCVTPQARYSEMAFTTAKILAWAMNLTWLERAQQRGFDETLLLNEKGQVTECTSANLFLVRGDRVWTPPVASGCLPGVTRAVLLEEIRVPGIQIAEAEVQLDDLARADEVFITSSTRDLLPVSEVEGVRLDRRGPVLEKLSAAFQAYVEAYVSRARAKVFH
ncbi:MAG: aminotransferase class IV [Bryobacteraceae bacterium]|nr:aminotransferase class IV [Bryobacteraceae bacterium]MDW8377668.1 aminotransferase class IV [Bryobacterales bacterium]